MKNILFIILFFLFKSSYSQSLESYVYDFIKEHEGLSLKTYICPGGKKTIGYGHSLLPNESYGTITKSQAELILKSDFLKARRFVYKVLPNLNYNQHLAISHFVYCIGIGNFMKSTLYQDLKNNRHINNSLLMWTKINKKHNKNLLKQRQWELKLFYMQFIQGDLLCAFENGDVNIIAHQTNCCCGMGAGIAKVIAEKYPNVKFADEKYRKNAIGTCLPVFIEKNKFIVNLYAQNLVTEEPFEQRRHWLICALNDMKNLLLIKNEDKIGIPLIGSGLAADKKMKGNLTDLEYFKKYIQQIILSVLHDYQIRVYYL